MYISPISIKQNIPLNKAAQCYTINFRSRKRNSDSETKLTNISASEQNFNISPYSIINSTNALNSKGLKSYNIAKATNENAVKDKHHPDFYKLKKDWDILASCYFRRGGNYGSASDKYTDVINSLKIFFNPKTLADKKEDKVKMLIGGIGESQEPFSLLATVQNLIGEEENIGDVLDMHTVDLQGKPDRDTLFEQSFYDEYGEPKFARSSFETDFGFIYGYPDYKNYRIKDDIFEYLSDTYDNPEKSKWKSRIQDTIKEYQDEEFDIISVNNTIGYILDAKEREETTKNIFRALKPNGIFISDNRLNVYKEIFTPENSKEIYPGIFQKL